MGVSFLLIPILIAVASTARSPRNIWLHRIAETGALTAMAVGLLAALIRLSHAIWATAQFAIGELLMTFFAASFVSMLLIQRFTATMKVARSDASTDTAVYGIVFITFALFLAGSAWCWGVFGRAKNISLKRGIVLVCGWISALGLGSFALLIVGLISMIGQKWASRDVVFMAAFLAGSLLALPGILVERRVRRFAAQQAVSARGDSQP